MTTHKSIFSRNPRKTIIIINLVLLFLIIQGAEVFLSTKKVRTAFSRPQQRRTRHIVLREHAPGQNTYFMPTRGNVMRTDSLQRKDYPFSTDNNGFIGPTEGDGDLKIVFFGGSTTECLYVDEESRYPYLAGKLLERNREMRVATYNSGVSGNSSMHSNNILLNKVLPMEPDIAVMHHNINDLSVLMLEGSYWNNNPSRKLVDVKADETESSLYRILRTAKNTFVPNLYALISANFNFGPTADSDEWARLRGRRITVRRSFILSEFRKSLQLFLCICEIHNISPVFMTQASRLKDSPDPVIQQSFEKLEKDFGVPYATYKRMHEDMNQAIRDVAQENNVLCIDLARLVPKEKTCLYDAAHYNEDGSVLVAGIIAGELETLLSFTQK
jgi:hypothetical protein